MENKEIKKEEEKEIETDKTESEVEKKTEKKKAVSFQEPKKEDKKKNKTKKKEEDLLMKQDLNKVGIENLNPLTKEVISRQPTINIGTIGHVAHGKCLKKGTLLFLKSGKLEKVENIKVGDLLLADDGTTRKVLTTTKGKSAMFKISVKPTIFTQSKIDVLEESYVVNSDHILTLKNINNKKVEDISVKDFLKQKQEEYKGIKFLNGIEYKEEKITINPYLIGFFFSELFIQKDQKEIKLEKSTISKIEKYLKDQSILSLSSDKSSILINNSSINFNNYKYNSKQNRLLFITGLFDSNNSKLDQKLNNQIITLPNISENQTKDLLFIARSLGMISGKTKTGIIINVNKDNKLNEFDIEISKEGEDEYYGFNLDGNGRFVLGDFSITHNSTVVKAISGVKTVRFKNEMVRNITIKLGYANAKIYQCDNPKCPRPDCYCSRKSDTQDVFDCPRKDCGGKMVLKRHVSFVDCPGHDVLMATMLNGAAVMDAALLLIASNEPCPQPQTKEHLAAVEIMKLKHIIILQNKIDLITKEEAGAQYADIKRFIKGSVAQDANIIPISAQKKLNIEAICEYITKKISIPKRNFLSSPRLIVIRSFDVNKPGEEVENLKGGVAGGSILQGVLKIGQEIEIRPGIVSTTKKGKLKCEPIFSKIKSLKADENQLQYAVPGGLIGVGTKIDPTLTRADRLVGQVLGEVGKLPDIYIELEISYFLLHRLLGVKTEGKKDGIISELKPNEHILVNIGSTASGAKIVGVKEDLAKIALQNPVCTQVNEKIAISRRIKNHFRLIGWGKILRGKKIEVESNQ